LWAIPFIVLYCSPGLAETNLTLYGVVDMGIASKHVRGPDASKQKIAGITSGGLSDSLIGIKGQEALANGWSANFQLESLFDGATGELSDTDRLFNNAAWLGLGNEQLGEF